MYCKCFLFLHLPGPGHLLLLHHLRHALLQGPTNDCLHHHFHLNIAHIKKWFWIYRILSRKMYSSSLFPFSPSLDSVCLAIFCLSYVTSFQILQLGQNLHNLFKSLCIQYSVLNLFKVCSSSSNFSQDLSSTFKFS